MKEFSHAGYSVRVRMVPIESEFIFFHLCLVRAVCRSVISCKCVGPRFCNQTNKLIIFLLSFRKQIGQRISLIGPDFIFSFFRSFFLPLSHFFFTFSLSILFFFELPYFFLSLFHIYLKSQNQQEDTDFLQIQS